VGILEIYHQCPLDWLFQRERKNKTGCHDSYLQAWRRGHDNLEPIVPANDVNTPTVYERRIDRLRKYSALIQTSFFLDHPWVVLEENKGINTVDMATTSLVIIDLF
jgi:hypothetical protein